MWKGTILSLASIDSFKKGRVAWGLGAAVGEVVGGAGSYAQSCPPPPPGAAGERTESIKIVWGGNICQSDPGSDEESAVCGSLCVLRPSLPVKTDMHSRLTEDSKLPLDVNLSMCALFMSTCRSCDRLVTHPWWTCHHSVSWDLLQPPSGLAWISSTDNRGMDSYSVTTAGLFTTVWSSVCFLSQRTVCRSHHHAPRPGIITRPGTFCWTYC